MAGRRHRNPREDGPRPAATDSPQLYQRLFAERNCRWAKVIVGLLAEDKRVVVVVGMDHMLGAEGLPALLRARGL